MMTRYRYIIAVFLLIWPGGLVAQDVDTVGSLPGIQIETAVDAAEAYIGDPVTYTLTITHDSSYKLTPPPLGANLGAFDVKDYRPDNQVRLDDGRVQSKTTFVLSTFTTGEYTIPPLPVIFTLPDNTRKLLLAEPVPITILSLLENAGDSLDIKQLKEPYAFPHDRSPYYFWGGLGLLFLLIVVGIWLLLRKRKQAAQMVDMRPPWEKAFETLAFLKQKNLIAKGEFKQYYFELTETVRAYLGRMYETYVLEMTTEQFLDEFADVDLPGRAYEDLKEFFTHADQVKFARFVPSEQRAESDFELVHQVIESVRADFERRQAESRVVAVAEAGPTAGGRTDG